MVNDSNWGKVEGADEDERGEYNAKIGDNFKVVATRNIVVGEDILRNYHVG